LLLQSYPFYLPDKKGGLLERYKARPSATNKG